MAFVILCNNKGCGQQQAPYIDNDKAFCSVCNKEISNISIFSINQMKALKQFKPKVKESFSITCSSCKKENRPILINRQISCPACKVKHNNISEPFRVILLEKLKLPDEL